MQATSPYGEEGAAGARETCAAVLTAAPAMAALRAFLHVELSGPTAHAPSLSPSRCVRLRIHLMHWVERVLVWRFLEHT